MYGPGGPSFAELLQQALSSTRGGYDLLAPKFDRTPFRTPDDVIGRVVERISDRPIGMALDLCCGTGAGLGALDAIAEVAIGIDFSPGMIATGRERLAGQPVHFVRGDALALPFGERFDLVTSFGAMGHFEPIDQPTLFAEVARILRPGGRFVTITSERPPPWRRDYWILRGFNAVMRVRNALVSPPFIMYYLHFDLPVAVGRMVEAGLDPYVQPLGHPEAPSLRLLIGHKPTLRNSADSAS
ncbi:MAG: class I SAM-dependent methyltransferase [Myxococcota bacterium]